ncbi:MAG TPA: alpha/beta fold hydrolase [Planctomycetes bacterium]|nr:alpha/beta fold hydrolase [Fuerstiella sp.]HIK94489.1 alpha/beta fold hydrolase [Planctomycetota bacterium]
MAETSSGPSGRPSPEAKQLELGADDLPFVESVSPDNFDPPPQLPPPPPLESGNEVATIRVFYGTDRRPTGSEKLNEFYGGDRGSLSVGFCDVSIPPNHKRGKLEAPSIWRFEIRENPNRHVMLRSVQPVDGATFVNSLMSTVSSSIRRVSVANEVREIGGEVFVFVHGYNVTFKDAARRTAQMAHDLEFPGVPVLFSWPSLGEGTLAGYREDERSAEWCEEDVMDFVTVIAEQSGARRIHLIAHSMGNRVLTGVLRRLAYSYRSGNIPKFNEVILTAPDVDAETFKLAIAPRITGIADRFTVYASQNDVALKASAVIHTDGTRLGQGGRYLTAFPRFRKIDMIDASNVDTSLFAVNHFYYGDSPTVLDDIANVLIGARAESRGLKTLIPKTAWRVPKRLSRLETLWR